MEGMDEWQKSRVIRGQLEIKDAEITHLTLALDEANERANFARLREEQKWQKIAADLAAERDTARAETAAHKSRGDNHWETMRCIFRIATEEGDMQAIIQHIKDAGSGYTEWPEETLRRYQTELAETRAETDAKVALACEAMREHCADMVEREGHGLHVAIRYATIPAHATAALAARDKATREQALMEAADLLASQGYGTAVRQVLALIDKPAQDGGND